MFFGGISRLLALFGRRDGQVEKVGESGCNKPKSWRVLRASDQGFLKIFPRVQLRQPCGAHVAAIFLKFPLPVVSIELTMLMA